MRSTTKFIAALIASLVAIPCWALDLGRQVNFSIPAQELDAALVAFSKQAQLQVVTSGQEVKKLKSAGVTGTYTIADALQKLLNASGLSFRPIGDSAISVGKFERAISGAATQESIRLVRTLGEESRSMRPVTEETQPHDTQGIPEILVKGARSLNTDIKRTEDAPQPYVVFGREEIQRSQAVNLDEFLRTRLPMNTESSSAGQVTGNAFPNSRINLRGLGENQTLVLVDGRRMPSRTSSGVPGQPDLNGIPLSAIERIEVLPSTAGGIYGGSATGGVVNIVLRRDFRGLEAKATYVNTFDTDAAAVRLDANAGFSLEGGRTQVMIAATRSEANNLVIGDRDFAARAIALQRTNNPANIAALTTPPLGATVNIRGVGGALLTLKPLYGGTALGAAFTHIPVGYAGPASDSGAALVANAGRYNLDLPAGVNGLERGLVAAPSMESASLNVRREFGSRLEAFLDVSRLGNRGSSFSAAVPSSVANLPANAPNNPFQQAIAVSFPTPGLSSESRVATTTVRATGGLIARLPHHWMGEVSYGWSQSRSQTISTLSAVDSVGACVLGRGVAANVILGAPGPATPCAAGDPRPALNILQEGNTFPIDFMPYLLPSPNSFSGPHDTILTDGTLRLSGPVVNLPGGSLSLSALIERREERIQDGFVQQIQQTNSTSLAPAYDIFIYPHRSQDADSYYVEARAPLISRNNARSLVRELELQASVRHDRYETMNNPRSPISVPSRDGPFPPLSYTTGRLDSTDYTLALRYAPLQALALRASFGTGFLPPAVTEIPSLTTTSSTVAQLLNLGSDPRRGNTPVYVGLPITRITGGNPDLQPELSESVSVGVILTSRFAPGFRLSIDYTRIEKVDEIQTPASQFILDNEDAFPGRIVRGPNLVGDQPGWAGPITSFNSTFINIASTSLEACDIQADYTLATDRFGEFHGYAIATWQPHYRNQLLPAAPVVDYVGFTGGLLERRGNLGLDWNKGPLALSWNAQYYDSYFVYTALALPLTPAQIAARATSVLNQGSDTIPRQVYHDLIATYRFDVATPLAAGLLANSEISLGIQNLFDKSPPILASTSPISAGYSTYGDPRLRRYTLSVRKGFGN